MIMENVHYQVIPDTQCWEWLRFKQPNGYGKLGRGGEQWYAHRYSWFLLNGDIPEGFYVCHKCDNPGCVNPDHLFLGTPSDNMQDAKNKGRYRRPPQSTPNENIQLWADLYMEGYEFQEIADIFQMTSNGIRLAIYNYLGLEAWMKRNTNAE